MVILDPPLGQNFEEFVVASEVLNQEMPHFGLKAIRLSSLRVKNYFSPGGPHSGHLWTSISVITHKFRDF